MRRIRISPPDKPLSATVRVPGSKSYSLRAMLLASLAPQTVTLINPLMSDDTHAMAACLRQLGVGVQQTDNSLVITGCPNTQSGQTVELNAKLSAATLRFLLALSCCLPGTQVLTGNSGLCKRPVSELVTALRSLGAEIEYLAEDGYPPVAVKSSRLKGNHVKLSGQISSQYVSALIMLAPLLEEKLTIQLADTPISAPYLAMTAEMMRAFGLTVEHNDTQTEWLIPAGQKPVLSALEIEPDVSSASYFWALAALTGSEVTVENIPSTSKQADMAMLNILEAMGAKIVRDTSGITVIGQGIQPVTVDMRNCPDQIQTLAVLAAFAPGTSRISGTVSLPLKETDRLQAICEQLGRMQIQTEIQNESDVLVIHGGNPVAAMIETYGDHRMAMAFSLAGAALPNIEILDADVVNKTFPNYWSALEACGVMIGESTHTQPNLGKASGTVRAAS